MWPSSFSMKICFAMPSRIVPQAPVCTWVLMLMTGCPDVQWERCLGFILVHNSNGFASCPVSFCEKIGVHRLSKLPVALLCKPMQPGCSRFTLARCDEMPSPWRLRDAALQCVQWIYPGDVLNSPDITSDMSVKWKHIIQTVQLFVLTYRELPWKYVDDNVFFKHDIALRPSTNSILSINSSKISHFPESVSLSTPTWAVSRAALYHLTTFFSSRIKLLVHGSSRPIL